MTKITGILKLFSLANVLTALLAVSALQLYGVSKDIKNLSEEDFKHLRADSWQVIGNNIVLNGRVHMPVGTTEVFADKAIINLGSRDFEAVGNVRVYSWDEVNENVSLQQIAELEKQPEILIKEVTSVQNIMGERAYSIKAVMQTDSISADRVCGNWNSGYFRFDNMVMSYKTFTCRGERAEHLPSGETIITNGEISACDYLQSNNAHYSIAASQIKP